MRRGAGASAGHEPLLEPALAWEAIAEGIVALGAVDAPIADAVGRVLATPARAVTDLPPFDRSAMDGFAVRAAESDRPLRVVGDVAAGGLAPGALASGTAVAISTGAPLPPGADAVIRAEHARVDGDTIVAFEPVTPGRFVRYRAEDVREGDVLAPAGRALTVGQLVSLASAGIGTLRVFARPHVWLVVNGDELQAPGSARRPGSIFESNGIALRHLAERAGARVTDGGMVGDQEAQVRAAIASGLEADVLIVSGGMSVGPHDHVKSAFRACGVREVFWRVSVKPGKPMWFGRRDRTLVFGLPGNPLSSLVAFLLFVEPALRRLRGDAHAVDRRRPGRLAVAAAPEDGRTTLLTATFERAHDGVLEARPTPRQGSHMTGALGESDGFVILPRDAGALGPGDPVELLVLDDLEGCA
jgi:molybdopterin molybdotransferase